MRRGFRVIDVVNYSSIVIHTNLKINKKSDNFFLQFCLNFGGTHWHSLQQQALDVQPGVAVLRGAQRGRRDGAPRTGRRRQRRGQRRGGRALAQPHAPYNQVVVPGGRGAGGAPAVQASRTVTRPGARPGT